MNNRIRSYSRYACLLTVLVITFTIAHAQSLSESDLNDLQRKEDTLKVYSDRMVFGEDAADRFRSDSFFVRTLVRALRTKNSFWYPFDSLNISKLYSPDSTFRIFTWQLKKDEYVYLQKGAIQMNTPDGSLKLFPLFDYSMYTAKPVDSIRTRNNWIGAIYYRIIPKEFNNKKYYTLLGFDDFSVSSNKKWLEVLHFNDAGEPVFGGPFISFKNDTVKRRIQARFMIEYKKEAKTFFNYDADRDMIVFDHLVSETDEPERKASYIPDGDFEGFKWENGQWVHVQKIEFDFKLKDGDFPREASILDESGKVNEQSLEEASRKNMQKGGPPPAKPATTPKKPATPPKKKTGN